ncbi:MAG: TOBE domain-containing protein, partial [Gaiellaceae bacterium]
SLDRRLRDRLLDDLERLFDTLGVTALYITHDLAEAFALGDRVAILREGRVVQTGTPDELWTRPASEEIARFLGLANIRDGVVVRPESVRVVKDAGGDGVVEAAVRQGPTVKLVVRVGGGEVLEAAVTASDHPQPGDRVRVEIDPAGVVEVA